MPIISLPLQTTPIFGYNILDNQSAQANLGKYVRIKLVECVNLKQNFSIMARPLLKEKL